MHHFHIIFYKNAVENVIGKMLAISSRASILKTDTVLLLQVWESPL